MAWGKPVTKLPHRPAGGKIRWKFNIGVVKSHLTDEIKGEKNDYCAQ
jgi:hypothetical protein